MSLSGSNDADLLSRIQIECQCTRTKQVFCKIQSTFLLNHVLKLAIPESLWIDVGEIVREMKRGKIAVGPKSRLALRKFDLWVEHTILMCRGVIITERDKWTNL